jgi:hypothetical protein
MEHYDIPAPERWEDFEDLCRDLWALLWEDPGTRRHGRAGQRQAGVDIYGRPRRGAERHRVQCKLKTQILGSKLTRAEILEAIEQARTFDPPLGGFVIATTAVRDVEVEALVRQVDDEQFAQGSFTVGVYFWDDILDALQGREDLLRRHYARWLAAGEERPISIGRLPATGETFVAREGELAVLDGGARAPGDPGDDAAPLRCRGSRVPGGAGAGVRGGAGEGRLRARGRAAPWLASRHRTRQPCPRPRSP